MVMAVPAGAVQRGVLEQMGERGGGEPRIQFDERSYSSSRDFHRMVAQEVLDLALRRLDNFQRVDPLPSRGHRPASMRAMSRMLSNSRVSRFTSDSTIPVCSLRCSGESQCACRLSAAIRIAVRRRLQIVRERGEERGLQRLALSGDIRGTALFQELGALHGRGRARARRRGQIAGDQADDQERDERGPVLRVGHGEGADRWDKEEIEGQHGG